MYKDPQLSLPAVDIHHLINIVPLIQEKWSDIGIRLNISSDALNKFWKAGDDQHIPFQSRNTFCCIQMLKYWTETSSNSTIDALVDAIDVPYIGLGSKILYIKTILESGSLSTAGSAEEPPESPPKKIDKPYIDMKAKFCKELSRSQLTTDDILLHLQLCNITAEIPSEIVDFPSLIKILEKIDLLNKADLSWLKYIATSLNCTKATEVIEKYETLLFADKITWSSKHPKGTYLLGKISKPFESVTIKDISVAKSAASKAVKLKEIDSISDFSETGSVIIYWRVLKSVTIDIPNTIDAIVEAECRESYLTHVGVMMDGILKLRSIDELTGMYKYVHNYNNIMCIHIYLSANTPVCSLEK